MEISLHALYLNSLYLSHAMALCDKKPDIEVIPFLNIIYIFGSL